MREALKKQIPKKEKKAKKDPAGLTWILKQLEIAGISFAKEHRFCQRMYRFDIAIIDRKIAIEYEGLMSAKSRHTTPVGFTEDCNKYNLAQSLGWKVYRFTALNYKQFSIELINI